MLENQKVHQLAPTRRRKLGVVAALTTTLVLAASPADASVTVNAYNSSGARVASATGYGVTSAAGWGVRGTLYDRAPGDARCARVYSRGYNAFGGSTAAQLEETVCAGGSTGYPSVYYWAYGDRVQIMVCAGYITTTPKQCSGWVTAG